jgi:hypothetical protein
MDNGELTKLTKLFNRRLPEPVSGYQLDTRERVPLWPRVPRGDEHCGRRRHGDEDCRCEGRPQRRDIGEAVEGGTVNGGDVCHRFEEGIVDDGE